MYHLFSVRDPAWLTVSLIAASVPLYNLLVLSPTASVIQNPIMETQSPKERETWLASFGRKSIIATILAGTAFGCTLLVLGSPRIEGDVSTRNPLRF